MFKLKKNSSEEKIKKSKEIIKEEKRKIKEEKKKIKSHTKKKRKKHIEKEIYTSKEVAISIVISMILGAVICISAVLLTLKLNHVLDSYKDLSKLIETYKTITNNYYGDIDKKELIDTATNAMMESVGDNFTTYSNSEKTESFLEDVEGSYEGIGCTVTTTEEGKIKVVSMFDDSPAKKAGLKENDIILAIDGTDYQDKTSNDVAEYVKNSKENVHVLYRVTPDFRGDNLLANGVEMEAYSVEDSGKSVSFNVYVYNVQPGININYKTGENWK